MAQRRRDARPSDPINAIIFLHNAPEYIRFTFGVLPTFVFLQALQFMDDALRFCEWEFKKAPHHHT